MSNVHALRTQARRYDEASLWIAKLDDGLSDADTEALKRWMTIDSENAVVLLQMAQVWDKMDVLSRLADVVPHSTTRAGRTTGSWLAAAATILVTIGVGLWGMNVSSPDGVHDDHANMETTSPSVFETAVGAQSTVELSDGTDITLNTNSRIRVAYSAEQRLVFLERGEIHIDVAHDASRPLSVVAGNRVLQAVGTTFIVRIDSAQQVELVVTEGRVLVGARPANTDIAMSPVRMPDDALSVAKGEEVMLGGHDSAVKTLAPEDIEVRLSWRDGNLIFRGEALGKAVAEISRYTQVEFVFMDDDLQKVRIAGLFKAGDVTGFLAALQANFDIAYERIDDDRILLKSVAVPSP